MNNSSSRQLVSASSSTIGFRITFHILIGFLFFCSTAEHRKHTPHHTHPLSLPPPFTLAGPPTEGQQEAVDPGSVDAEGGISHIQLGASSLLMECVANTRNKIAAALNRSSTSKHKHKLASQHASGRRFIAPTDLQRPLPPKRTRNVAN